MIIKEATPADIPLLEKIAAGMGARVEAGYFDRAFAEGRRIFVAGPKLEYVGYVHYNMRPNYAGFRRREIPEAQDLAVLPDFRNRGIGRALIERCEAEARAAGLAALGLSVGLTAAYGPAQRLYAAMGYMPDGAGVAYDDEPVPAGALKPLDGNLTLKLVKILA